MKTLWMHLPLDVYMQKRKTIPGILEAALVSCHLWIAAGQAL